MRICSLIPPATAISKTQDRADTSVWWKWPFSISFIIYYVQRVIINKVCKPELWCLCSALHLYEMSRKYLKRFLNYRVDTSVWAIINKVCKPELWSLCSAHSIFVLYICMKFHEHISNDFQDIERTHVYDGNGHFQNSKGNDSKVRKQELRFMCSECHLMVFNICVKFHENMSSGFKVMERTQKLLTERERERERTRKLYTPLHCILRMPGV